MARQVVVFRNRLRQGVRAAFGPRASDVYALAERMPGFLGSKDFVAEDGERLSVIEFASAEELESWRVQAEHARAQGEGRSRWFSEYSLQVCRLLRESRFSAELESDLEPESQRRPVDVAGGCACGTIRYRVRGVPREATICHCIDCRRAAAAPLVAWVTFATSEIEWEREPKLRRSSERATRSFCPECGAQLAFQLIERTADTDLTLASLDDPARIEPLDHTFTRSQLPWVVLADGLPRFATARDD